MYPQTFGRRFASGLGTALLTVFSVVVTLAAAEGFLRYQDAQRAAHIANQQVIYEFDSELGWRKRANAYRKLVTSEFQVVEKTNSLGLRGDEIALRKPRGVKRVLMLGDSFTEAYTVNVGDSVSERLRSALAAQGADRVEIINAGTGGYSTDQELLYYLREGRQFEPDVVVLMMYDNDIIYNARTHYWRGGKPMLAPAAGSREGRLVPLNLPIAPPDRRGSTQIAEHGAESGPLPWLQWSRVYQEAILKGDLVRWLRVATGGVVRDVHAGWGDVPDEYRVYEVEPGELARKAWRATDVLIRALHRQVQRDGARLVVFYIPHKAAVYDETWKEMRTKYGMYGSRWNITNIRDQLKRICTENGIPFIDPVDRYRIEARRAELENDRLYFMRDGHWTPRGHRLAAEILAESLDGGSVPRGMNQMLAAAR